jgi:hypothetical protein
MKYRLIHQQLTLNLRVKMQNKKRFAFFTAGICFGHGCLLMSAFSPNYLDRSLCFWQDFKTMDYAFR